MNKTNYLEAYKNFIDEEIPLIAKFEGAKKGINYAGLYHDMLDYLDAHFEEFISLKKSKVKLYEYEFVEYVDTLFNLFELEATTKNIPTYIWFMPSVRLKGSKFDILIHREIAGIIRTLFDKCNLPDFITYRSYEPHHRRGELILWAKYIEGKKVLKNTASNSGIPENKLIIGKLKLFDESFVTAQYKFMSEWSWVHIDFVEIYRNYKKKNSI